MRLYHYSVDSYKEGKSLTNDFKQSYKYAEPFILALRESMTLFKATYYSTMYTGRELIALKLRKYENYQKDAVEAIFEYVRETEFPNLPSRLNCVYYCETKEEAIEYAMADCIDSGLFTKEQVILMEVEVEDERIEKYDQEFYNLSMEEIEMNHFDKVFEYARKYYAKERTADPLIEIVSDGSNEIIEILKY